MLLNIPTNPLNFHTMTQMMPPQMKIRELFGELHILPTTYIFITHLIVSIEFFFLLQMLAKI
jgi:hypothetical protein